MSCLRLFALPVCFFTLVGSQDIKQSETAEAAQRVAAPSVETACSSSLPKKDRAAKGSLPDLPGDADDSDGSLSWVSTAAHVGSAEWQIRHSVLNRASGGTLPVDWHPDVFLGWVPFKQVRGSSVTAGFATPLRQPGTIQYNKKGNKDAPSYKNGASDQQRTTAPEANVEITLTVLLNGTHRDVFLKAQSQVLPNGDRFMIKYCVALDPKHVELAGLIAIDWTAADSPQLASALKDQHGVPLIKLTPSGVAQYDLTTPARPTLRDGPLVVNDLNRNRLGAAYAPAYGPPR